MKLAQRWWARIDEIDLPAEDAARLAAAWARPGLVCPNHPSLHEPVVTFRILDGLGLRANYVMERETLRTLGPLGTLLQGAGAYSIRRGAADRDAFAATRRLLVEGRHIVIYPEGETYGLNDLLLPFHEGVAQMGLWGMADRAKASLDPSVLLVPMAVKYRYGGDLRPVIDAALTRLESQLGLHQPLAERYERLRRVGFAVVRAIQRRTGVELPADATLNEHIEAVLDGLVARISHLLAVEHVPGATFQDRLRRLYTVLDEQMHEPDDTASAYARQVQQQREPAWRAFEADLRRVQCFQAVRDGYVGAHPSAERYLDMLGRLEREVFGRAPCYGRRRALVRVGEPLDLACWAAAYKADRKAALAAITTELRARVLAMVEALGQAAPVV